MSVGGIRGGGRSGGPKGASGKGGASRAGGATFGKVDKSEKLAGASGLVGSGNVGEAGPAAAADPVTAQAMEIARQLKSGQLKSREEATKKFVAEILKDKLRMQSKSLTQKVADALQDDPRLSQALERIWDHGTR